MAGELPTPIDIQTGLPLPILPAELSKESSFSFLAEKNFHHHFHPRRSEHLMNDDGRAVRFSRGQYVQKELHKRYHDIFIGPELPHTLDDKFKMSVLACAGIVPPQAIDLSNRSEINIVDLSKKQLRKISGPGSICIEGTLRGDCKRNGIRHEIGRFYANYAVSKSVEIFSDENIIEEFLNPRIKPDRRRHLGNKILRITLNESLSGVEEERRVLSKEGYEIGRKKAHEVVFGLFLPSSYHGKLASQLKLAYLD